MSDQGQYDDMEDEELQMALLMSMQEVQPDEAPGSGAAVASVQPPQHSAPAQTAPLSAANNDLASQLQLALQQALAQMAASAAPSATVAASAAAPSAHPAAPQAVAPPAAFSTAAPALTSRQVAQQPQQQQQRQVGPAPTWVAAASIWRRPPTPTTALLPAEKEIWEGPLREALSKALGQDLQPGEAASLVSLEKGERKFNAATADALLNRLVNTGGDPLLALQGCWARSLQLAQHAEQQQQQVLAACLQVLQLRVLKKAVALLANDEDDLFFEGGRFRKGFMNGLESGQILPTFFDGLVLAIESKAESDLWRGVLKDSFKSMKDFDFAHPERHAGAIRRLDVVTQGPAARRLLAIMLLEEAASSQGLPGRVVEESFTLAPLMAVTTLPSLSPTARPGGLAFPAQGCFMQLRGYPRSRGLVGPELNSIRRGLGEVVKAAHEICKRVATLKVPDSPLRGREVWPAWVAAVCGANLARASAGSTDAMLRDARAMYHSSSDGFMCGLLAVALRFCRPFLADAAKKQGALQHLDPAYYTTQAHRVAGVEQERSLAGAMMPAPSGPPAFPYISPERPEAQAPHFVAEMFFLTQRLIRVGLMPAVHKSTALAKMLKQQAGADDDEDEDPANSRGATLEQWLLADSVAAQIMDPEFANDACQFMELQALWLVNLLQQGGDAAKAAFQRIPESVVSDMTGWLSYVIRARGADLFGGMDIGLLMSCLAGLLRHTELVPSPKTHFGIVNLLLSMLGPQLWSRQRPGTRMLAGSHLSAAEGALVSAVLGTGATQTELLPAIMKAYAHADHVVALDVDKDNYDKFGMRHSIDLLLMELWKDPACAASLARVAAQQAAAGGGEELFADFVGAVLNDLLYLLKDSLGRLEDIHALERSMADKAGWAQLSPAEQQDKKRFYQAQQRAAGGFMYQAVSTLRMLNTLTAHPEVQRSFLQHPIAGRAANACVHFLDLLVGPCCSQLAVDRPEQYFFDPDQLLLDTAHLMLRLAERPEFVHAISEVPDYDEGVMRSVLSALESRQLGEYEHRRRLEALMGTVQQLRGGPSPMETEGAAPSQEQGANASLDLAFPEDPEEVPGVEEVYAAALQDLSVGDFDSTVARAYNRHFAALAEQAAGDTAGKMKALSREMRNLRGRTQLPIYAASSIFVRHDSDRMDKVRALITGPEDTPYYGGCFFFDVYFPQDYPNVPPLMELETTGGGVARFNPNLYADGKVCLSLLGTWHGGHESEKWKPGTSTLFQVLLSIQGMIFIADPYFNEPAYDAMRGTSEGSSSSLKYNSEIWLNNIRYAMLDVLRRPRPGFEEVITTHFRLLRHRIMQQCSQWLQQAAGLDPLFQKRLRDAVLELHGELAKL